MKNNRYYMTGKGMVLDNPVEDYHELFQILSKPYHSPGNWWDGMTPMQHPDAYLSLHNIMRRGYDPNLILDSANQISPYGPRENYQDFQGDVVQALKNTSDLADYSNGMPLPDSLPEFESDAILPDTPIQPQLDDLISEYYGNYDDYDIDYDMLLENNFPAAASAQFFNNYTDDELLNMLKNPTLKLLK